MAITITNEGEQLLLGYMTGKVAAANFKLKLYTNSYTPTQTDTVASFTELGAVQSYVAKTLTTSSWNAATAGTGTGTSLSNKAQITYPQQSWTADGTGGAQTVQGYFITDSTGAICIGGEKFTSGQPFTTAGDLLKIDVALTLGTE